MSDPDAPDPLTKGEWFNVIFVLAATQLAQILMVAVVTASLFFVLGLILLSPELLAAWTRNGSSNGTLLGMTLPVPQALDPHHVVPRRADVHVHLCPGRRRR